MNLYLFPIILVGVTLILMGFKEYMNKIITKLNEEHEKHINKLTNEKFFLERKYKIVDRDYKALKMTYGYLEKNSVPKSKLKALDHSIKHLLRFIPDEKNPISEDNEVLKRELIRISSKLRFLIGTESLFK